MFYIIFALLGSKTIGWIIIAILGLIGFVIGTFKMPNVDGLKIARKTGGENLDDIIKRFFLFKKKKNKIYLYVREEKKDGDK